MPSPSPLLQQNTLWVNIPITLKRHPDTQITSFLASAPTTSTSNLSSAFSLSSTCTVNYPSTCLVADSVDSDHRIFII